MREPMKRILPVAVLAIIGLGVSVEIERLHRQLASDATYTTWCTVNSSVDCGPVLSSRYATLAGFSVALWAIAFYVALVVVAVWAGTTTRPKLRVLLANAAFVFAIWGVLFSLYMAVIAFAVLHTVCLMCSALYLTNIALLVAAWRLRSAVRLVGRRQAIDQDRLVIAGGIIAAAGVLAVGGWEALGGGIRPVDAKAIARERPDFVHWYYEQPLVR